MAWSSLLSAVMQASLLSAVMQAPHLTPAVSPLEGPRVPPRMRLGASMVCEPSLVTQRTLYKILGGPPCRMRVIAVQVGHNLAELPSPPDHDPESVEVSGAKQAPSRVKVRGYRGSGSDFSLGHPPLHCIQSRVRVRLSP